MRTEHATVFKRVADRFGCWIGLREPNPLSERWIGNAACVPKPESCKAKTADNPNFERAGLVIDPTVRPEAFRTESLEAALQKWTDEFLVMGHIPIGYTTVGGGPDAGTVLLNGQMLYADYDLMALLRSDVTGAKLYTTTEQQDELHEMVSAALNGEFGVELIQHGPEFSWTGGVGAKEFEFVLWFGPGDRMERHPSSMPPKERAH